MKKWWAFDMKCHCGGQPIPQRKREVVQAISRIDALYQMADLWGQHKDANCVFMHPLAGPFDTEQEARSADLTKACIV